MSFKVSIAEISVGERMRKDFGNLEELAASMTRLGQLQPIILDDLNNLVAGERRLRAAQLNGWTEILALRMADLDELMKKEIELEENLRRKEFNWPEEVLALEQLYKLKQTRYGERVQGRKEQEGFGVKDAGEEFGMSIGAVSMDLQLARALHEYPILVEEKTKSAAFKRYRRLREQQIRTEQARRSSIHDISPVSEEEGDGDEGAEDDVPGTQAAPSHSQGDQGKAPGVGGKTSLIRKGWKGKGLVYQGNAQTVLRAIAPESVDVILTDPPYALGMFDNKSSTGGKRLVEHEGGMYDDDPHKVMEMLDQVFRELARVIKPNGHAYFFYHHNWHTEMVKMLGYHFGHETVEETPIIWVKNTPGIGDPNIRWVYAYEPCLWINKGRHLIKPQAFNYIQADTVPPSQKKHPTEKPVRLLRQIIEASSLPNEIILDCFAGSGSTLVAAAELRRRFIGIELDNTYYDRIIERLEFKMAELEGDPSNVVESVGPTSSDSPA